jgi:hypothetical protein
MGQKTTMIEKGGKTGDPLTRALPFAGRTDGPSARMGFGRRGWFAPDDWTCFVD